MVKLGRLKPPTQALLKVYQVKRRLDMVAIEIVEISSACRGFKKLLVIRSCLTRFLISVPIKRKEDRATSKVPFEK